ncbi:MAG: hypothetical protein Q8K85_10765 [Hyphomicrobium sp.]|nr:hypothetical protein [Hyphomicrobium sp.]
MQFGFGSGSAWGITSGANPTPGRYDILQEASVDFSFSNKPLMGEYGFPVAVGRGAGKISGKMKWARLQGRTLNDIFFGATKAAGQTSVAKDETGSVPDTPFAITVANAATFVTDLGVRLASTLIPLVRVASAPATGQYSVSAGVYTFAAADTGAAMLLSYSYTIASTGETITIANQLIGAAPNFKNVLTQPYNSQRQTLVLNACVAGKLSGGTKTEDFFTPEMDYEAMADSSNVVGVWSLAEAS